MIGFKQLVQLGYCLSRVKYNYYQTAMASLLVPPPSVRGQTKLDYKAFTITLPKIPRLLLHNQSLNKFRGRLHNFFLKFPNFKPIQTSECFKNQSIVYLNPHKLKDIPDQLKKDLEWNISYGELDIELTYENWTYHEILRAVLPENIEVPSSYSQIGHIIHLNLRDEQLPYKNIIGQVLLDKIPCAKTVINKLDNIDNTFRNFAMEILAGEENTIVQVKESGCNFKFDFSKVYWNPRLATEHAALVNVLKEGDVLYDVFAGVGPFAIPAVKKGVRVLANDLNPESYKWLLINAEANKQRAEFSAFNKDGRDFLKNEVKRDILNRREKNISGSEHIVMNLPALAIEFLDIFFDWFNIEDIEKVCSEPPIIHLYCFIKAGKKENLNELSKQLVEEKLRSQLTDDILKKIHHVRNVAPNKEMMCVSFLLTKNIMKGEEPAKKKIKLENGNVDYNFSEENGQKQIQD